MLPCFRYQLGAPKPSWSRNSSSRSRTPSESSELSVAEKDRLSQNSRDARGHSPGVAVTKMDLPAENTHQDVAAKREDGQNARKIETIFSNMPAR